MSEKFGPVLGGHDSLKRNLALWVKLTLYLVTFCFLAGLSSIFQQAGLKLTTY